MKVAHVPGARRGTALGRLGNQNWRGPGRRAIHCLMTVPMQPLERHLVDDRP